MFLISFRSLHLLIFLLLLFSLSTRLITSMRLLKDVDAGSIGDSSSSRLACEWVIEGRQGSKHVPRVKLHEVHSGPNPISNSLPNAKDNLQTP